ncbi:UDP-2,4-diacetamido-2,4,6-trideoxy-beta-L-altropyranose hydrolase [Kineothrix alysoides]|uniref:UDP-2,4-diacetamido-2,4, 6-trideoxy-beta-L-altropyranose hydrolase n=1 Tax=Kineothrix alysoides TaxID=1469948 RepID=A0A4R1R256_9FIRM|nr:UDP-2,4-diacetamido-2,4,6-trideoxy-beta-L-altropyranose hydrolase [Kineothrix alysoides]TCL59446.1 UDP-2,4-diacetamido-2,4,6-trideoxy-beta-L-altropyranose hydrolase [Kineothrix alysoides]
MEIGSIYEIDPENISAGRLGGTAELYLKEVEKYNKKYCAYTQSGREAIAWALRSLEENEPEILKECLMPAYMCDTVFFPFEQEGWKLHFYHIGKNLEAAQEELRKQIEHIRPGLLFIHPYYGMDTWKPMRSLLKEWRSQGLHIMEDVTQSYYLEETGAEADYVIGSLRKWYPLPDGGFVASDMPLSKKELQDSGEFTQSRLELLTDKWDYLYGGKDEGEKRALKEAYLKKNKEMEEWLDKNSDVNSISEISREILDRENEGMCKRRRNENYKQLHQVFQDTKSVRPVFKYPEEKSAPLYFPVYAKEREEFQEFLRKRDVYAPVLWPVGKENEGYLSMEERYIFDHLLALPMDQRYGSEAMEQIRNAIFDYERITRMNEISAGGRYSIGIRADANEEIATGHIMRCITIAKQLMKMGERVCFFVADEFAVPMLKQAGMEYVCMQTKWKEPESELQTLSFELKETGCEKLLVDSYQVTNGKYAIIYFEALKKICDVIYIDDMFEAVYPVRMIINYNAYHHRFPYKEVYGQDTKLLLGTEYVPLREEFSEEDGAFCKGKRHVLLSSGGGDVHNALSGILAEAVTRETLSGVVLDTVVGRFHQREDELKALADRHEQIVLHRNVENMAKLMGGCEAAVSAAGTVLFELCAMQVPTVFFVCADNQKYDSDFFDKEERMLFSGDIRTDRVGCIKRICDELERLLQDEELRGEMKKKLHEVTDGNGAARIAEEIIKL